MESALFPGSSLGMCSHKELVQSPLLLNGEKACSLVYLVIVTELNSAYI